MKKISSKVVYKNPWISVREDGIVLEDGRESIYGVVDTPDAVLIVALSEENEVYLVKQFRYPVNEYSWEVPGGGSDDEDELSAAKRELEEELGMIALNWKKVGKFQSFNGVCSEHFFVFIARELKASSKEFLNEDNISEMKKVKFEDIPSMIQKGEIKDAQTITALMTAGLKLGLIKN